MTGAELVHALVLGWKRKKRHRDSRFFRALQRRLGTSPGTAGVSGGRAANGKLPEARRTADVLGVRHAAAQSSGLRRMSAACQRFHPPCGAERAYGPHARVEGFTELRSARDRGGAMNGRNVLRTKFRPSVITKGLGET